MPTDFTASFRRELHFKKKGEKCSWSRHCDKGSAFKEVLRWLEFFAKKHPDRYVFITPDKLTKLATGKYRSGEKKGKPLSHSTVEKCLRALQTLGIISPTLKHSVDAHTHIPGRIVAPHEACCCTYPKRCEFVGPGKLGTWMHTAEGYVFVKNAAADVELDEGEPMAMVVNEEEPKE